MLVRSLRLSTKRYGQSSNFIARKMTDGWPLFLALHKTWSLSNSFITRAFKEYWGRAWAVYIVTIPQLHCLYYEPAVPVMSLHCMTQYFIIQHATTNTQALELSFLPMSIWMSQTALQSARWPFHTGVVAGHYSSSVSRAIHMKLIVIRFRCASKANWMRIGCATIAFTWHNK